MANHTDSSQNAMFSDTTITSDAPTWAPTSTVDTNMARFMKAVNTRHGLELSTYPDLHKWSVAEIPLLWEELVGFFKVAGDGLQARAIAARKMPHARWYPHAQLTVAEHALRIPEDPSMANRLD